MATKGSEVNVRALTEHIRDTTGLCDQPGTPLSGLPLLTPDHPNPTTHSYLSHPSSSPSPASPSLHNRSSLEKGKAGSPVTIARLGQSSQNFLEIKYREMTKLDFLGRELAGLRVWRDLDEAVC